MSRREREIYTKIADSREITQKQIIQTLRLPPRTVRHVIRALRATKLIRAKAGEDLRSPVFYAAMPKAAGV